MKIQIEATEEAWRTLLAGCKDELSKGFLAKIDAEVEKNEEREAKNEANRVLLEEFEPKLVEVMRECHENNVRFLLDIDPVELLTLYGITILAAKHPGILQLPKQIQCIEQIQVKIEEKFEKLGFGAGEIDLLRIVDVD